MPDTLIIRLKRLCAALFTAASVSPAIADDETFGIAIHGGAGTLLREDMTPEKETRYRDKLAEATEAGYAVLERDGSAIDAVIAAIRILEDSPLFNAGVGAVFTYDGHHELDASIMDGATREAGAVAAVQHIRNPIELARRVMEQSPHVMLVGPGAEAFAATQAIPAVDNSVFSTPERRQALDEWKASQASADLSKPFDADHKFGTVGAVARDKSGNLAAGTSTGGMTAKRFGRVGDSPIIGAGTWADNASCAVSATGHGEYFIRYHVAADICSRVQYRGVAAGVAANEVIHDVLVPAGGAGGVIVMDSNGEVSMSFNTEGMYRASRTSRQPLTTAIFGEDDAGGT